MRTLDHQADVCVVGGGMAGICAALAAARHGATVALVHDRPVLGGGASSENRVHICGANRVNTFPNLRETGIIEELRLENLRRNPHGNFSVWDTVLYEKVRFQPNLKLFLNTSCLSAEMAGDKIKNITGWQLTTQTYHKIEARVFIDCSGDAILAPLSGALWRMGREARSEFNESYAPEKANPTTMGMTCLFQTRDMGSPQPFEPPAWAHKFPREDDIPYPPEHHEHFQMGYWWVELGGEHHGIHDTEEVRDELLKIAWGVWDHIKNYCVHREKAKNYALEWIQFLPTKRESRRYIGEHVLTQNDVEAEGKFEDIVGYGGWPMDDHKSGGFHSPDFKREATIFHPAPSPYGIPYRSTYSKNIKNLMFAGRCGSFTHMALSSTRVMATCSVIGQAVGTAASLAVGESLLPGDLYPGKIKELQNILMDDDCYLPWQAQEFSNLTKTAELKASVGNPEVLRDGVSRPIGDDNHRWECKIGDWVEYLFGRDSYVEKLSIVFDSDFSKLLMMSLHGNYGQLTSPPEKLVKEFHVDLFDGRNWKEFHWCKDNHQRLVKIPVVQRIKGLRFTIDGTWGGPDAALYALYV